jgi:FkbM family methyltransferase
MEAYISKLLENINTDKGFYIECGANDGITQSYTYELERLGWNGILIEASEEAFNKCKANRSSDNLFYNCALVSSDDISQISGDFDGNLMSSVGGNRLCREINTIVKCRTLTSILEELSIDNIDLFSLDVEGYELEVLKGFDIKKYHPKYIIIEVYNDIKDDIFNLMARNNYSVLNLTDYTHENNRLWDGTHNDYLFTLFTNQF